MTTIHPSRPTAAPGARPPALPPASSSSNPAALDPIKLLQKYKWLLGLAAAAGIMLGTAGHFALLYTYPTFTSAGIFECWPIDQDPGAMDEGRHGDDLERLQNNVQMALTSDPIIDRVVNDPRLPTEAPKWSAQFMRGGTLDRNQAAIALKKGLRARAIPDTSYVRVQFSWRDPDEVQAIANIVQRVFLADRGEGRRRDISHRKDMILGQIRNMEGEIQDLQRSRDALLLDRSIDALDARVTSAHQQMRLADEKLSMLRMQREEMQVHLAKLEAELASPVGINFPDSMRQQVEQDPQIANQKRMINQMESEIRAQSRRGIGPDHRDRRRLESRLEAARHVLEERSEVLLQQAFDAQLDAIRTRIRSLMAQENEQIESREAARVKAVEFTQIARRVNDIEQEIARLHMGKANFSESLSSLEITTAGERGQRRVTVFQPPQRPREVSFPKLYLMIPAGLLLVLGLVGGTVVLIEVVDQRVKSPADVALIPRTRVLGLIAHAAEDPASPPRVETVFRDQPGGVMAEHFRQLRGAVLKRMQQAGHKSLVIMSGMPDSGASTVSTNLALAMAAAEHRVLLVDANFRRPSIHKHLGLPESPGLADVLAGTRPFGDAVQQTENDRLHILSAGSPDNRMFERLGTESMAELLREASSQYDLVLVDVAPAMVAGDALSVANRADASLLVVRAMGEKRGMVARLRNELSDARAEFLGVLVNQARSAAGGYLRGNILATHSYRISENK